MLKTLRRRFNRARALIAKATAAAAAGALFALASSDAAAVGACPGRIPNPLTDVCWSCTAPITIAGTGTISAKGALPDVKTNARGLCTCGTGLNTRTGINLGFWEPLRTAEIVRHSGCFPSLGGIKIDLSAVRTADHARTPRRFGQTRRTAFWQVHWYQSPWLFVMEALLDNSCLDESPWDLAYLSELDPLWDDALSSFLLNPDAALFTAGAAFGACAVDCAAASVGLAQKTLYWCSGCQGSVFPLSGWMAGQVSPLQAWHLMAHRFAMKLSREGVLWYAHGSAGQCSGYVQPLFEKDVWRTQLMFPSRTTSKSSGACCQPLGRSTALWGAGKTFANGGEDGAILLWRRRDCCMTSGANVPTTTAKLARTDWPASARRTAGELMRLRAERIADDARLIAQTVEASKR